MISFYHNLKSADLTRRLRYSAHIQENTCIELASYDGTPGQVFVLVNSSTEGGCHASKGGNRKTKDEELNATVHLGPRCWVR